MQLGKQKMKSIITKKRTISGPKPELGLQADEFVRVAVIEGKTITIGKVQRKKKLKK